MMPVFPQTPAEQQSVPLSKERETSSIPKAGEDGHWVYPSPQQFYHALLRNSKAAEAEAMGDVVLVHNATNEKSWQHVLEWEHLHRTTCPAPSLLRFVGRSGDLSWGAWWSKGFSYRGAPFDRHDWYVDRCGQKVVRYVIDYYDDPCLKDDAQTTIVARPAFDSLSSALDRLRRPRWHIRTVWEALFGSWQK